MKSENSSKEVSTRPNSPAMERFGQDLRRRRKQLGLSQLALARRAGTTQATIAHIEAGRANATVRTLEGIALALGNRLDIRLRHKVK
jgi:transcriptional regulator with XRE-family HTH domain